MSLLLSLQPMKKFLFLSIIVCFFSLLSFAQYVVKPAGTISKIDTVKSVSSKKVIETTQSLPMAGASKSVSESYVEDDEDDLDEKELNELEASIAKAKATLGLKNVSTTSSKSVPSKNKEVAHKIEEPKTVLAAPTAAYEAPTLMINGRAASESKPRAEFKTAILTEEEKKFYNEGGLKVNLTDEIERDSIYVSPTIPPSFVGGVDAMKAFFAQNLKVPEVLKGQEIKGRVFIRFIVRKDGKVDKVHLVKGPNDDCNSEAIRVIKMMPAWTPASDRGDAVSSYHVLPISFSTAAPIKK
jgi:TonB family protein